MNHGEVLKNQGFEYKGKASPFMYFQKGNCVAMLCAPCRKAKVFVGRKQFGVKWKNPHDLTTFLNFKSVIDNAVTELGHHGKSIEIPKRVRL